jgi:TolB-like protein/DNA-binding winged helix-turn-helix (wHTH) protein
MDGQKRRTTYEFGDFRVDVTQRLLLLKTDGRPLPLSSRAFDTLLFFLEHPGELLDKSTLMAAIWPKVVVEENNLTQHISALRRVLGERPEEHRFIVTVPGRGYRFVAPVTDIVDSGSAPDRADVAAASGPAMPATAAAAEGAAQPHAKTASRRNAAAWALGAAGVVLGGIVLWYLMQPARRTRPAAEPVTSIEVVPVHKPRLAVLPFENLSPDPANAFFADGLHEEIVSTIAQQAPGVEVISRTTMMSYRGNPPKPTAVVARELHASHLIEGSVRREANKIRLTLQLIDARTDGPIWSASYDRALSDTLTLESQVAEEVTKQMSVRLTHPQQAAAIQDTEAFDLYLKAVLALRTFTASPGEMPEFQRIEDLLTRVIDRQPEFARAYAERARARTLKFIVGWDTSEALVNTIRSDLDTARRLAPNDPHVLAAIGYLLMCENDTTGALKTYEAAEAAGLADPEWLIPKVHLLLRRSRIDEMNATVQRMFALDPSDPLVIWFAWYHLYRARQPAGALQALEYARSILPPLYETGRALIFFDFAGRTNDLRAVAEFVAPITNVSKFDSQAVYFYFVLLRYEHRYVELRALFDRVTAASDIYYNGVDFGPVGQTPTALFRGWTDLLLGDRAAAAKNGHAVLQFVDRQTRTPWNGAFLEYLAAAGHTFTGNCERARAAARSALSLISRADNAVVWANIALLVAQVDAWCGGEDDAVELLRQLSIGRPGWGPAVVSRDPLFTVPLGKHPGYRALTEQLENVMRNTKLEPEPEPASPAIAERRSDQTNHSSGQ